MALKKRLLILTQLAILLLMPQFAWAGEGRLLIKLSNTIISAWGPTNSDIVLTKDNTLANAGGTPYSNTAASSTSSGGYKTFLIKKSAGSPDTGLGLFVEASSAKDRTRSHFITIKSTDMPTILTDITLRFDVDSKGHYKITDVASGNTIPSAISPKGYTFPKPKVATKPTATTGTAPTGSAASSGTTGTAAASAPSGHVGITYLVKGIPLLGNTADCPTGSKYSKGLLTGLPCNQPIKTLAEAEQFVVNLMNIFLLPIVGLLFTIMFIAGGITYITSAGNTKQIEKGKAILTAAIIGLLITILAFAIVSIFAKFIGGGVSV